MSRKQLEIEFRGPLNEEAHNRLLAYLVASGVALKKENRFLIDYSTFIEGIGERTRDVRVRVTNGRVEIIVKEGKFGGTSRKEASIYVVGDDLDGALSVMAMLGYRRGVACDRGIARYKVGDIEIAIQEVRCV